MSEILIPIAQIALSIALLLVAILCLRLDGKLNAMRKGKDGVAASAKQLSAAVSRAEAAIKELRSHSDDATALLQKRIDEAQAAADKLAFLASTARALEPRVVEPWAREPEPKREPQWADDDFVPARRDSSAGARWGGLR